MVIFLFLGILFTESLRFVALPSNIQSCKSYEQMKDHYSVANQYFSSEINDILTDQWTMDIFMLLDKENLAAYLQSREIKGTMKNKVVKFINLFYIVVPKEYNGKGLCYSLIENTIEYSKKQDHRNKDGIVALHLSASDIKMPVALKCYYNLGFKKAIFCVGGPGDFSGRLDVMVKDSIDIFELIKKPEIQEKYPGGYVTLHCFIKDLKRSKDSPSNVIEMGEKLREILKSRKDTIN